MMLLMCACLFASGQDIVVYGATPAGVAAALQAGSSTTALRLATSESSIDDALIGLPIQHPAMGTGFRATSLIMDYVGATRDAVLAETLGAAPGRLAANLARRG